MRKLIFLFAFIIAQHHVDAQTRFLTSVKIEFERNTNPRKIMEEWNNDEDWFDRIKDKIPTSASVFSNFIGDTSRSIYKPGKEVPVAPRSFYEPVAAENVVYTDYATHSSISQKPVFEETFLITDSLTKIRWKITNEVRNIAGFECRKAYGVMNDSIGVFAFYTDQILVNGGPEGIQGLPGMILGVGIPRLHTTWFATKVEIPDNLKAVVPPSKGKKTNKAAFISTLLKLSENWGTRGKAMLLNYVI